jgi:hypothetical protein
MNAQITLMVEFASRICSALSPAVLHSGVQMAVHTFCPMGLLST